VGHGNLDDRLRLADVALEERTGHADAPVHHGVEDLDVLFDGRADAARGDEILGPDRTDPLVDRPELLG
jgi:hypothetical protein